MDYIIDAHQLSRRFGDLTAVNQLNLQVTKGTIYGFLGPNGSGKSTAIRLLTGLLIPSSGQIQVLGHELPKESEKLRTQIGYMTQKFSLFDDLSVIENLQFIAKIYGFSGKQAKNRIQKQLDIHDLTLLQKQIAGTMSGGQKQRLALAAATIHEPELLFLDEPTSAVDPESRRNFWEKLFDLCDLGTTILVSTHYMDEAERCHQLAILENGIKRADGAPDKLMHDIGANIVEVSGPNLRKLKQLLISLPDILSAAQLGTRLRVLVDEKVPQPDQWIKQFVPEENQSNLSIVRPTLEDVFVTSTGAGRQ